MNGHDDSNRVISRDLAPAVQLEQIAAVQEYWSDERLLSAEPIGVEADEPPPHMLELLEAAFEPEGEPESRASAPADGAARAGLGLGALPAAGFDTARVPDRSRFPYAAIGKLFMTFDDGDFVASAWVVGGRSIFTAGHCLYESGRDDGWADRVLFIPQYHQGAEPLGRWTATSLFTLKGWAAGGQERFKFDMAGALLDRPIAAETGTIGWLANAEPPTAFQSVGYPARRLSPSFPFDGREMWRSNGVFLSGDNPMKMANNMTEGCSGGPWLIERDEDVLANGLNSFRWNTEPDTMNSPHFGAGFLNLLDALGAR